MKMTVNNSEGNKKLNNKILTNDSYYDTIYGVINSINSHAYRLCMC